MVAVAEGSLDIANVQMRINGVDVSAHQPFSVALPLGSTSASNAQDVPLDRQIRAQLARMRSGEFQNELQRQLTGHRVRAALVVPGEEPLILRFDRSLLGRAVGGDIKIGCGVKLIVASALHDSIAAGQCSLQTSISELLDVSTVQGVPGSALRIQDLLNHRHGLEDEGIRPADFVRDGRIDLPSLVAALDRKSPRLVPGLHYSYSRAGYWLLAAALQRLENRSLAEILASQGVRVAQDLCPAMGNGAEISGIDLLRFLVERLHRARSCSTCAPVPPTDTNVIALPGWHVIEKGMQSGWKVFQKGWLGHNVTSAEDRGMIRVHPETGAAMYIWAPAALLPKIAAHLFGTILPESLPPQIPRRLPPAEWIGKDPSRYLGAFRSAAGVMRVQGADRNGLSAHWQYGPDPDRSLPFKFAPAEQDVFFTVPVRQLFLPFVQFISSSSGMIEGLWNGRRYWPRVDAS
jgi:hypothetical protein